MWIFFEILGALKLDKDSWMSLRKYNKIRTIKKGCSG